jgi:SM-20-related protein
LGTNGWFLRDDFITPAQVAELRACAARRLQAGEFTPARIGTGPAAQRVEDIRGDAICWLQEPLLPAETHWLAQLEQLRAHLNRELLLGLFELEMHYARYPPGGAYGRHVDQPAGSRARRVSLVLYLNDAWAAQDGGELRLHRDTEDALDIAPLAGRLVGFLSERQAHEVLACRKERLSLSGWMRVRP